MAIKSKQGDFEKNAKHLIDDSVTGMSAATQSQLNQARQFALSHTKKSRVSHLVAWSAFASAAAVALLILMVMPTAPLLLPTPFSVSQLEQLVMVEDLDLYSDLEFYQWLDDDNG